MSYRQALDEAIGHAPVSTVDVDRVISRQRRARRLRMWGAGGAGAAAVLAVTLTAGLLSGTRPSTVDPAVDPTAEPTAESTTVAGTEADWQRLDDAVVAALKRMVPAITWPESTTPGQPSWRGPTSRNTIEGYSVTGDIVVNGTQSTLIVRVARFPLGAFPCEPRVPNPWKCGEFTGPNGGRFRTMEDVPSTSAPGQDKVQVRRAIVVRADNIMVDLHVFNKSSQGLLPLTIEQMTTVAFDPAVKLSPLSPGTSVPGGTSASSAGADPAQQDRLDKAVFAALRAQIPDVTSSTALEGAWSRSGSENDRDNYWGQAPITNGSTRLALFSVNIRRTDPGFGFTCGKPSKVYSCRKGEGPNGEQYRIATNITGKDNNRTGERTIVVLRKDGSWLEVNHASGGTGPTFALTEQQQLAIALSSTLTLAPR